MVILPHWEFLQLVLQVEILHHVVDSQDMWAAAVLLENLATSAVELHWIAFTFRHGLSVIPLVHNNKALTDVSVLLYIVHAVTKFTCVLKTYSNDA